MSTHVQVPGDVEAESLVDLVQDCREISGVLGSVVPAAPAVDTRGVMPVEIGALTAAGLDGYGDYGS